MPVVGELLWYKGTRLHTIKPGKQIEGGDIATGDGTGRIFVESQQDDEVGWNVGGGPGRLLFIFVITQREFEYMEIGFCLSNFVVAIFREKDRRRCIVSVFESNEISEFSEQGFGVCAKIQCQQSQFCVHVLPGWCRRGSQDFFLQEGIAWDKRLFVLC